MITKCTFHIQDTVYHGDILILLIIQAVRHNYTDQRVGKENQFRDKNAIRNLTLASFQFLCLIMGPTMSDRWEFQENQP